MSDLRPTGEVLIVNGEERHILFTLNAIDSIQSEMNLSMEEVITELTVPKNSTKAFRVIIKCLLNDEVEREKHQSGKKLKEYTEKEIGWMFDVKNIPDAIYAIFKAYGMSLPEGDEEESPNQESAQQSS